MLSILAAILNIGDIRLEGVTHPHVGEISNITNTDRVNDGMHAFALKDKSSRICD